MKELRPKIKNFGTLTRVTVGEKNPNKTNKTILLVGESGAGKSKLVNTLFNYAMGVKFEDEVWFQIVEEEEKSQTESQTSDVIVYEICCFEDEILSCSLTIIDTPGYEITKGTKHEDIRHEKLLSLFQSDDGVHEVHAVGLVMKASDNRLSDRLMYNLNSMMSLFGKDLEKNIVALITHSDGRRPKNSLQALEAAKIKCARNEKNQPVYFLFNNCQHEDRTEEREHLQNINEISERGIREFTTFLKKTAPLKLTVTVEVLNERITLKACIQNLRERIELTELKQAEIKQIQEGLKKHEEEMKKNEEFTVEVDEIALKADSVSTIVHLDFLIEKMKEERDTEKVQKLEEMKDRVDEGTRAALRYKQYLVK
ncbi:uncharacterized protein LOC115776289 [Archocentrus centrarchus]|uniref:uncharacterized protein LOC115776289 n=1 Tax=Archocentrus centrarchus TaxID=63155 RepID=UPI0011E9F7F3|nr:uncharacterized protein LOC115776289 [Archocentrus centrarchus]